LPPAKDEAALVAAGVRGLDYIVEKLEIREPASISVYVYPDLRSKESISGKGGDGHAVPGARALHVITADSAPLGPFELLVRHEGTHLLATSAYGPAGSAFMAEGLAVWVAGGYGGRTLDAWKSKVAPPPTALEMLSSKFRQMPEKDAYPLAGLFIDAAVKKVGLANVREHLLGATSATWKAACAASGSSPEELDAAWKASKEQ
jgi:hypothetical protein